MREYTKKLLTAIDDGEMNAESVMVMCLEWLSEADVKSMCLANDLFQNEDDEEDA